MVTVTALLDIGTTEALDTFDSVTHMAFGDSTTTPTDADTVLGNELLRITIETIDKDTINNIYTFTSRVTISQLNSSTVNEIGLFDAASGGNMAARILSPTSVTKTSDDEDLYTIKVRVNTINA